jgi:CRISPR-associated protein Cas1
VKVLLNTLYVQTQGSYLRLDHETLKIEVERELTFQIPLHHLGAIVAFGNVLISPFLIHRCAEDGRALIWLSEYGRFRARANGSTSGNVLLRRSQYAALDCSESTLLIARYLVAGKLQNARLILMRSAREAKDEGDRLALSSAAAVHAESIKNAENAESIEKLRGIEGYAAKAYFAAFTHMIRLNRDAFTLTERSRRPPRDPINAMLSFIYTYW